MVTKIVVANRAEIAVRIIRSCREMELKTVAVYSEPDRTSSHVLMASEAYPVGPAPSSESYLRMDRILEVARQSEADAIHPGYGFLSENVSFATAVRDAGLVWIGPSPESMTKMGDKVAARALARQLDIPIIPGSDKPVSGRKEAQEVARRVGFPVLVKAVGGGGGKGMRIANSPGDLIDAVSRASSEASTSFSDKRIFIEKYLPHPRHIEIQVAADAHGSAVSMTERECSIQRRYQKIIEESPSPCVTQKSRGKLASWAKKIALNCGYLGVGTVEFLMDEEGNFYFLEMNTRLQVEHPVTEMLHRIDLVKEQIRISCGEKLSFGDELLNPSGHAMECRIYAEDGFQNFTPSTGTILGLEIPDGFGIRFDHGLRAGQKITPYYDPLLGKLITWGTTRKEALTRMKRALSECHIAGVETTVPFCFAVMSHPRFGNGTYDTHFISEESGKLVVKPSEAGEINRRIASIITAVHLWDRTGRTSQDGKSPEPASGWKALGRKESLR